MKKEFISLSASGIPHLDNAAGFKGVAGDSERDFLNAHPLAHKFAALRLFDPVLKPEDVCALVSFVH